MTGQTQVEVTVHSYLNPTGRCDECRIANNSNPGCCDEDIVRPLNETCPADSICDPVIAYCSRPLGSTNCSLVVPDLFVINSNSVNFDSASLPVLFGLTNPPVLLFEENEPWAVSNFNLSG